MPAQEPTAYAAAGDTEPFTFAWISDTQIYAESYPRIFNAMTQWLASNAQSHNIRYLFHTGDVVNQRRVASQWQNAVSAMAAIRGVIPFGIAAGNHDVGSDGAEYSRYLSYFGAEKRPNQPSATYYAGGRGQYDLLEAGGQSYLILTMGYAVNDADIAWMNAVLRAYPGRIAILGVHSYLNTNGSRTGIGELLYQKVVKPNSNVRLVLCGHMHAANRRVDSIDDDFDGIPDRTVVQLLADYQGERNGGQGYIRLLRFDPANGTLKVSTYSPWLNAYERSAVNDFSLDWEAGVLTGKPGWQKNGAYWHYFLEDGSKAAGWRRIAEKWFYFRDSGAMATGWIKYGSNWYFLKPGGEMASSEWLRLNGAWYYLRASGAMHEGWLLWNGKWYYLKHGSGVMAAGWQKAGSNWFYLRDSGVMATGWVKDGGRWYYLRDNGAMHAGWVFWQDNWYFLKANGAMAVGWQKNGNTWYYLGSDGAMHEGWLKWSGKWYYLKPGGGMVTGTQIIEGKAYRFDKNGALLS